MKATTLLLLLTLLFSCNNMEIEDDAPTEQPEKPVQPDTTNTYLTVEEAISSDIEGTVTIKGYIVGYIHGNSIKKNAKFSIPTNFVNTNLLIADHLKETDPLYCLAVKLEKSGGCATRDELNLLDHPELFHRTIIISGNIDLYFARKGITRIYAYKIAENEEEGENVPSTDEHPTPGIDENEQVIPEGRSTHFSNFSGKTFGTLK